MRHDWSTTFNLLSVRSSYKTVNKKNNMHDNRTLQLWRICWNMPARVRISCMALIVSSSILSPSSETAQYLAMNYIKKCKYVHKGIFWVCFMYVISTLLHLRPLRFHCVGGCWDRSQDCCYFGIDSQTLYYHSARSHPQWVYVHTTCLMYKVISKIYFPRNIKFMRIAFVLPPCRSAWSIWTCVDSFSPLWKPRDLELLMRSTVACLWCRVFALWWFLGE